MKELSLHILDIVQNSLRAGADLVEITIIQRSKEDLMVIEIKDNGNGMTFEEQRKVLDPFYTTRTTRRIGLGLPLFKAAASRCNGVLSLESALGVGTRIKATFQMSHWDRPPLGDISETLVSLIVANPHIDFVYKHQIDAEEYCFNTKSLRFVLEEIPVNTPSVLEYVRRKIKKGVESINKTNLEKQ